MPAILRRRNTQIEGKLDSSAADHSSLLQASIRILEVLEELENLTRRVAAKSHENGASPSPQLALLQEKFDLLSREWNEALDKRDAAALEAFATIHNLIETLEKRWGSKLEDLHSELRKSRQLVSEHLPLHVESSAFGSLNPEVGLMIHLYSFLPALTAVDVGANRGEISQQLLDTGYEVYAFEPFPQIFEELRNRLGSREGCYVYELAVGAENATMELHIAEDSSANRIYGDISLFSSLVPHSMPPNLNFTTSVSVAVRSLKSLALEHRIPLHIGLLKIDTEGYDLQVLRGMEDLRPCVLITEFWSPDFVFGRCGAFNRLEELVKEMRARGYRWHMVLYRVAGSDRVSFYCNHDRSVSDSWGNVFFFQDYQLFMRAVEWGSAVLPNTYLNVEHGAQPLHLAHEGLISAKVNELETRLAVRDREIAEITEKARGLEESLGAREEELAAAVAYREHMVAYRKQMIEQLESALSNTKAELQERSNRVKELTAAVEQLQTRIRKIRRSFSWKLTSPVRELRRASTRLGQIFGKGDSEVT